MEKYLYKGWSIRPKSLQEFEEVQNDLNEHTIAEKHEFSEFDAISFGGINEEKGCVDIALFDPSRPLVAAATFSDPGAAKKALERLVSGVENGMSPEDMKAHLRAIEAFLNTEERIPTFRRNFLSLSSMKNIGLTTDILMKITKDIKFAFYRRQTGELIFISELAWNTLVQRLNVGKDVSDANNILRDAYLASKMKTADPATFIMRKEKGVKVLVAAPSTRSEFFRQTEIQKVYKEIGKTKKIQYVDGCISDDITEISFVFPEDAKYIKGKYGIDVVPGMRLSISDTCKCGIRVVPYFEVNGIRVYGSNQVKKEHRGRFTYENILAEMHRVGALDFEKFPEVLKKCAGIMITPADADLSTTTGQERNRFAVTAAYKSCIEGIEMKSSIGLRREEIVRNQLGSMDPTKKYSALDIVMSLMQIPDEVTKIATGKPLHPDLDYKLRNQLYEAPFFFARKGES